MGERFAFPGGAVISPRAIEREVDSLRQRTELLLSELERRLGHRLMKARAQAKSLRPALELIAFIRRHTAVTLIVSASTLFLLRQTVRFVKQSRQKRLESASTRRSPSEWRLFGRAFEGALLGMLLSFFADRHA